MCILENKDLVNPNSTESIVCRYVGDDYVMMRYEQYLIQLETAKCALLTFKICINELSMNYNIPFLDITVDRQSDIYVASVY